MKVDEKGNMTSSMYGKIAGQNAQVTCAELNINNYSKDDVGRWSMIGEKGLYPKLEEATLTSNEVPRSFTPLKDGKCDEYNYIVVDN